MKFTLGSWLVGMNMKNNSRVISHAQRRASKRGNELAGIPAIDEGGRTAGRPQGNDGEQDKDNRRAHCNRLQEAAKELNESHFRIMGVGRRGVDVTSRVDLRCEHIASQGPKDHSRASLVEWVNRSGHRSGWATCGRIES